MKDKKIKKRLLSALYIGLGTFFSLNAFAQTFNLEQGGTKLIRTEQKIDTIFVSSPTVADYEILDDNSFIIYAKEEGRSEITAFGEDGKSLTTDIINVNSIINNINDIADTNRQIKARFPNSNLSVKKVGQAYVIEGKALTQEESDEAHRIVGEALGKGKKVTETSFNRADGASEYVPFLDKYQFDGVINNANVRDTTQINVKLSVVEVNKKLTEALGINWGRVVGVHSGPLLGGSWSGSGGFDGSGSILQLNATGVSAFINALDNQNNGKILAEPSISLLSGETADILVGGEIPFAQKDKDGGANVTYKEFGVKLLVGAKVQKNNRIRLALDQSVSSIAGSYSYESVGTIPFFNTRRAKSIFEVADGESFIIGGLFSSQDAEGINKIPLLGDIPVLGAFFRNAKTDREDRELVIVATVNVVKPVQESEIVYPTFEQTGTMERFFNLTPIKNVYHKTLSSNFLRNGGFIQ
ncbi:type II and III secretion system protein family protein [Pasteurella canis]|uniref:Secretin n=1 Tax=Pasteurella canis TaxID=753 RepID=A0ABQ4VJ04_9PAST|nr:type II and III secretion system protein family protein [Pasteurella canis]MXN87890.1 type II and III secretion system protein family protein [Pasteurella canis]UDW84662.1 type II and III secretion system protein family protein [Pasteurella canis]UEC24129.1 type II and III secretion system protein family protein [Pasteurella canis]GJH42863.1 secretin [Pasteurella canis]